MSSSIRIAASLLSADLSHLSRQVAAVEAGGADWMHIDVMDGRFVPPITFGRNMVAAVRQLTQLPLDVHLMVVEPERFVQSFADAGATLFTFHPEATIHAQRLLASIRSAGMRAGLALNPGTPLEFAEELIDDIDLLLVMSVNPGFGGQDYLPSATDKLRRARQMLSARGSQAFLSVDGGISRQTIAAAHRAGADTFAAGSAIFGAADPQAEIGELRRCCCENV